MWKLWKHPYCCDMHDSIRIWWINMSCIMSIKWL